MSVRRSSLIVVAIALLSALAYGVGWASAHEGSLPWTSSTRPADHSAQPTDDARGAGRGDGRDADRGGDASPSPTTGGSDDPSPSTGGSPSQTVMQPGPRLFGPGDSGPRVRDLQARLKQIAWFDENVTGYYGDVTATAVRGFQGKRGIPVTGVVDQRTLDRLYGMTRQPTQGELTNQPPAGSSGNTPGPLDARCLTGRALCVDKSSRTLRWVVDGKVLKTVDVRFGSDEMPTREGAFTVQRKDRDHVSTIYHTSMPYAMFFSGGQAVHYSSDFAARGYSGASHGCVNVRDQAAVAWLYDQVQLGDKVIVYWS